MRTFPQSETVDPESASSLEGRELSPSAGQHRPAEQAFTAHLELIQRVIGAVVRRHQLSSADAEEFASTVYLRLIEGDYRILREFRHQSSIRTFLNVVIERLYLDFRNHQWGKWRPSARARRQGSTAVLLERLVNRDGFTLEEAVEIARAHKGVTLPIEALDALASRLQVRPRRRATDDGALTEMPDSSPLPDELVARAECAAQALPTRRALKAALLALGRGDQELIDLRFREGLSVVEIARLLRLDQKPLYRRFERLLRELRKRIEADARAAELAWRFGDGSWRGVHNHEWAQRSSRVA